MAKKKDFEALALPQLTNLYRTALYILDDKSDAQEMVQDTFVRAYHSWDECQLDHNRRIWLFGIMTNVLVNKYRPSPSLSAATNNIYEIDSHAVYSQWVNQLSNIDPGYALLSTISEDHIRKAIGNLPLNLRLIVVFSLLEDFSYREIANIAGINLETVKVGLYQGRILMQRELFDLTERDGKYDIPADRVRSKKSG